MDAIYIERLNKEKHSRETFDCGIDVLNLYLKTRAHQEQKKNLNVTHVAISQKSKKEKKPILGYYTLSNSALASALLTPLLKKGVPPTYKIPTVQIGRLAVDKSYQKNGLGTILIRNAFLKIIKTSTLSGIRGVEVVAKNAIAVNFYKQLGFVRLHHTKHLHFLPLKTLLSTISHQNQPEAIMD